MTVRAEADNRFIRRYIYLALAGLAFLLWASYDELYKFPKDLEMAIAYAQIKEKVEDESQAVLIWQQAVQQNPERGWTLEKPENTPATVAGYRSFNRWVLVGGAVMMVFFLWKYFRTRGSWMESTATGVTTSWGQSLEFDQITKINKRRWEAKGIAKVYYTDAGGRNRTLVFDDFKYEREPMGKLMAKCEENLAPDKIVGGKTQAEIAAEAEANAAEVADQEADQESDALEPSESSSS